MKLSIVTQNGDIVNYDNVTFISATVIELEDEEIGKTASIFGMVAQTSAGTEVQLGFFETEEELDEVCKKLEKWLTDCNYPIFHIPVTE